MIATTGTGLGRTPEDIARAIAVLRDWDQRPRKADLAKIKVPTLVIVGEREPRATIEGSREWASWIPGAEFVVLPGAHHAAPREAAPAWNAAVQGFPPARLGGHDAINVKLAPSRSEGHTLECRDWPQEAAFRMLQNTWIPRWRIPRRANVYGGTGARAFMEEFDRSRDLSDSRR